MHMPTEYVGPWKTVFLKTTIAIFLVLYAHSVTAIPHHKMSISSPLEPEEGFMSVLIDGMW